MSLQTLTVTLLGTGTSTGVPVVGCRCPVCLSGLPQNQRTRCSALLSCRGKNILIDTSTDLRQQALREKIDHVDAVLYTHTHADHLFGIDDLRPLNPPGGEAIPLYGSIESLTQIRRAFAYIFSSEPEPGYRPRLTTREVAGPFALFSLPVVPIPLLHGRSRCYGYRIGPFAYLTDCSAIPPPSEALLQDLEVLVIDALRFRPHATHFNIPQAMDAARRLGARRTLLTHLGHDVDYAAHAPDLPDGVELACDGQRLTVELDLPV